MKRRRPPSARRRRGSVLILVALAAVPLLGMVAFAVDYGYLLKAKTDLQRAADSAALAAVMSLTPTSDGFQDLDAVRAAVRQYAAANTQSGFSVLDSDIVIGRFEPSTVYTNLQIVQTGVFDTVRVTLRRDGRTNPRAPLFFARAIGLGEATVTATATAALQKVTGLKPGADILPFVVPLSEWDSFSTGDYWCIYGDGQIRDEWNNVIPGNWGTVDIGATANSTSDLNEQILNGLQQSDIDVLYEMGLIQYSTHISGLEEMTLDADTGLSAGLQNSVYDIIGMQRLVPLYDFLVNESGDNMQAHIVGWGVVTVSGAEFHGAHHTYVEITKSYMYDGDLYPQSDLANEIDVIENAFTVPVLLE